MEASGVANFTFSQEHKKHLNASEQQELIKTFKNYDKDSDGKMNAEEYRNILIDLGNRKTTLEQAKENMKQYDKTGDGLINWEEFVLMTISMKGDEGNKFGTLVGDKASLETAGGGKHTYSLEEVATFSNMINVTLEKDEDCKHKVPIKVDGDDLFHAFDDGIVLCKLTMAVDPECIDRRAINFGE